MSDGITDAARQTERALEYARRKAEKEMSEQPKEYIITEEQLHSLEVCGGNTDCDGCEYSAPGFRCTPGMVASDIRSRPHTSAPAPEHMVSAYAHGKVDGAKAEREQFAKELLYNIDGETGFYVFPHQKATAGNGLSRFVLLDDLTALVKSLRQPEPQQEGRR